MYGGLRIGDPSQPDFAFRLWTQGFGGSGATQDVEDRGLSDGGLCEAYKNAGPLVLRVMGRAWGHQG